MQTIIVGAGLVGSSLAEQLLLDGHDISIVEKDPDLSREIEEKLDLLVVNGSGSDPHVLTAAGIESADILLAVTPVDEVNFMACAFAKQFNVPKRIARIRNSAYVSHPKFDLEWIGVTALIDPETAVVDAIYQFISTPGSIEAVAFENGKICLREFKITRGMPIIGRTLREIREKNMEDKILVMTIVRKDKAIIPTGDLIVEEGDDILVVFPEKSRRSFLEMLDLSFRTMQKVVISGSSLTCFKLARRIQHEVKKVIWVSRDYDYGSWGAEQLDKVEVLHGDCTGEDLLKDIHIENADFFVAAGTNTEHNILSSLLAKSRGVKETVIVSDQPSENNILFRSIGINHVINPRITTAASIMDLIHRGRKLDEIRLRDQDLEAIRLVANVGSRICNRPLSESWRPLAEKAIVGAIIRNEELIIPGGNTIILPNDQALIITRTRSLQTVSKLFRERS